MGEDQSIKGLGFDPWTIKNSQSWNITKMSITCCRRLVNTSLTSILHFLSCFARHADAGRHATSLAKVKMEGGKTFPEKLQI